MFEFFIKDIFLFYFVSVILFIRYLPQIYFDIVNNKREVFLRGSSKTKAIYIFCLYILIYVGFIVRLGHYSNSIYVVISGVSIFLIGVVMGLLGLLSLNYQYSEELVCFKQSRLVKHGIYSIVRHPMRVGLFIELLGIVIFSNTILLFFPLVGIFILQAVRTKDEELMLQDFFGKAEYYYQLRVPKVNFIYGIVKHFINKFFIKEDLKKLSILK